MCLSTSRRSTTSAGAPSRPRLRLLGWRFASASYTAATISSSASTRSAWCIQSSRRSLTSSAINPSPKLSCARRISIISPPRAPAMRLRTQQLMIELADLLDRLFQLLVIVEPTANLGDPLATHTDLLRTPARVGHSQDKHLVPFAARALRTVFAVPNGALQQRAA